MLWTICVELRSLANATTNAAPRQNFEKHRKTSHARYLIPNQTLTLEPAPIFGSSLEELQTHICQTHLWFGSEVIAHKTSDGDRCAGTSTNVANNTGSSTTRRGGKRHEYG